MTEPVNQQGSLDMTNNCSDVLKQQEALGLRGLLAKQEDEVQPTK